MPRFALELVRAPEGVSVTFRGGASRLEGLPGGEYAIGRFPGADIFVKPATQADFDGLIRNGWGGRKSAVFHVKDDGRWVTQHPMHGGSGPFLNGQLLKGGPHELFPGDEIAPASTLVFRLLELAPLLEPAALLDAIADAPGDVGRWHVLADWLIEHEAPHALMAAYELKLEQGTNDPELIGDYAAVRRIRQHLPIDVPFGALSWRCGYVVSCSVGLGPRDRHEAERLAHALSLPQLGALSTLTVLASGTESAARLEAVLKAVPATVRTLGFQFSGAVPTAVLSALSGRPPRAHTLRLRLAEPLGPLRPIVQLIAATGWTVLDLEGTRLTERSGELLTLVREHPRLTFVLGGTWLGADAAKALDASNVRWAPADADALAVDAVTSAVLPLSRSRGGFVWGLPLEPLGESWVHRGPGTVLESGDPVLGADRRYVFLQGPSLDERYREYLANLKDPGDP